MTQPKSPEQIYAENKGTTGLTLPEVPGCWVSQGESMVAMRRMDELKSTIDLMTIHRVDTQELQRAYDQVHRALTKAFGLPR